MLAPALGAARLTYENVTHRYGQVAAVSGFSLDIAPGEIVSLLGPSGCGKTTLLRLAAGVERPLAGSILINGVEVAGDARFTPPERRGVGLMFQDFALFPHLSNLANVMFGLKSLPRAQATREARAALDRVGLGQYAAQYPHTLSGGEQQRVALARAIAPRPSVLLMDEPFSGLDRALRTAVRADVLAVLREAQVTAVMVTHDAEEAMLVADRVALMRGGRLIQEGDPATLYGAPVDLRAARFFSELNEIPALVRGGSVDTPLGRFATQLPDGPAIVAIRPQGIGLGQIGAAARLQSRRFLGEAERLVLLVNGIQEPLVARVPARLQATPGTDVSITVDPAEVLVFAASEA
jgi:iron(III) transport system ATP-binding protein